MRERDALAESVGTEPRESEFFGEAEEHGFEGERGFMAKDIHRLGDRRHCGLAERLDFAGHARVAALEFPALEVAKIRKDIVGVHRGAADENVVADEERQFRGVAQDLDVGVTGRERIGGRSHVEDERLYRIRISVADGGDDLLVNITRERIPVSLGQVAFENRRLFIGEVVADGTDAEGGGFPRVCTQIEFFALGCRLCSRSSRGAY
jgi:hypothetical protein